jgi:hypothetical protein
MRHDMDTSFALAVTRRSFLGTAGAGAIAAAVPSILRAQDVNWRLECTLITGGAPYRPAFSSMFLDPMFLQIQVGPNDLGVSNSPTVNTRKAAAAGGRGGGSGGGRGDSVESAARGPDSPGVAAAPEPGKPAPSPTPLSPIANAPGERSAVPPDMPIIPSVGIPMGVNTLTRPSPSVVLLNDQTEWIASSRRSIESAFNANDELLGIVVFHNALGDNQTWPLWYQEITGGLLVQNEQNGLKKTTITRSASFEVHPVGNHPIVQDVPKFQVTGEDAYKGMWQSPKITPLLEATGASTDRVVAWIGPNPSKGRVVVIQPGTSSETLRHPAFHKLVRNTILWAGYRLE